MSFRMIALLRILSSLTTSLTVAPVSWTLSAQAPNFWCRMGINPWPLSVPSKCPTTLWAAQLRSPSLTGAVGRVWGSDWIESIHDRVDPVGVLVVHELDAGQKTRLCDVRNHNDSLALPFSGADWIKFVFDNPVVLVPLTQDLEFQQELALQIFCATKFGGKRSRSLVRYSRVHLDWGILLKLPSGWTDSSCAIEFKLCFGSLDDLNPWFFWEFHWEGDILVQVDELLTLVNGFWPFSKQRFEEVVIVVINRLLVDNFLSLLNGFWPFSKPPFKQVVKVCIHVVRWVHQSLNLSLNGCLSTHKFGLNLIKPNLGKFLQNLMLVANPFPTTGLTEMNLALNTHTARPQGTGMLLFLCILARWTLQYTPMQFFPQFSVSPTFNHPHSLWPFMMQSDHLTYPYDTDTFNCSKFSPVFVSLGAMWL